MPARSWKLRSLVVVAMIALASSGCAWVERASIDSAGNEGNADSGDISSLSQASPGLSADGRYIAFESAATNLVAGDTNNTIDMFVRDTLAKKTTRVSVDSAGNQANGSSYSTPALSADGRYIAFSSFATNLVAGDTNNATDVFVRDTVAGTTTRVSVDSAGTQGNDFSEIPAISADGRYVAFDSIATNLIAGDTNNKDDVFVRDTVAKTTSRVSVDSAGNQAGGGGGPTISADGRDVAFISSASDLVAGDTNNEPDVFVRDTVAGTTTRINVDSAANQADDSSTEQAISADGRFVAFSSFATNLVAGDTNGSQDVFVRDTVAGVTTRVSVDSAGNEAPYISDNPSISGDGRFIAFISEGAPLVPGDTNLGPDVYVRDTVAGTTREVSLDAAGNQSFGDPRRPAISSDGRYIAFATNATDLITGDTNRHVDVYVRANPQPAVTGVTPSTLSRGTTTAVTITGSEFIPGAVVIIDGKDHAVSDVTVVSPTKITANITVDSDAALTARNVWIQLPGTGPGAGAGAWGVCASCVTVN